MGISVGQAAPDFTLKDQSQQEVKLVDFRGKRNVVLMFYPLDWSPVCTSEHACMAGEFKQYDIPQQPDIKEVAAALAGVK